jgi:mannosyltransferase
MPAQAVRRAACVRLEPTGRRGMPTYANRTISGPEGGFVGFCERRFGSILFVLLLSGAVLRFTRLGAQSLWIDEALSYDWIDAIRTHGIGTLLHDIHGPLQALAIWGTSHVSRDEWWLRVPSAVAGVLAIPALACFGRALWGAAVGSVAAALLALSPFAVYYSQESRNYAFTILFASLLSWAALAYARRAGVRRGIAVAAAELAAIFSNLNALFFIFGLGIWGLGALRRRRHALAGWVVLHLAVGVLLLPYAWEITHQVRPERLVGVETGFGEDEPLRGPTTLHPMALPYTAYAFAAGYSLGPTLEELRVDPRAAVRPRHLPALLLVALGFGVPLVAGLVRTRRRAGWGLVLLPVLATVGFTIWLAAANMKPYNVRYLSVLLPAFLLWVAWGLLHLPRRWGVACATAAVVASAWSCANYLFVPRYGRDEVREAVHYVAAHADPEDAVLQISLTGILRTYYTALGPRPVHPPARAFASVGAAEAYLDEILDAAPVVWYLECRPQGIDPRGVLPRALAARATSQSVTPFAGVRVHRYVLESGADDGGG